MQMVRDAAFTGRGEHAQAFMFGWDLDVDGKPVVGNGSDNNPFLVGITSKTLLVRLGRDPGTYILHVDATFKLNQVSYPVLVLGMSDKRRRFHLTAMVIVSQIVEDMYTKAFAALKRVYTAVTGKQLMVYYVMGDAYDAQYNAIGNTVGEGQPFVYLMCFFHVMKNVNDRLKSVEDMLANRVRKDIYDLHFAASLQDFVTKATTFWLFGDPMKPREVSQITLTKYGFPGNLLGGNCNGLATCPLLRLTR
ncbi:hypothetical protein F442_19270 [Phytophthora nicotianae P10297]|uniref:MULE transposase domain-containing protein n=1 Tax=Phytophthora nicotianae P10297 TaxID=1317064 RepID=W2YCH3_PHYNI|nr:hypothetical protein F442_19270 [Phytophthora nicotianae P10297]